MAIIKVYYHTIFGNEMCDIIEDCHAVSVCSSTFIIDDIHDPKQGIGGSKVPYLLIENEDTKETSMRFIDFTNKHGDRTRLAVRQVAYVCSNDGKTIERVIPYRT